MSLTQTIPRPSAGEFDPYFSLYIDQAEGDDALACLRSQEARIRVLAERFPGTRDEYRYAPGKSLFSLILLSKY